MAATHTRGQVIERRLAAIMMADVVGYSRLMGNDEVGTLRALDAHRNAVLEPMIAGHHGRLVKTTGDGFLAEFQSVVAAVSCASAIQRAIAARNAEVPPDRRLDFRIGINLGDIIVEGSDIFGDGVNVASRLEALAEPGGVAISGTVHDQIRDKLPLAFADRGEQTVKNISHPVHVWTLGASALAALADTPATASAPRRQLRLRLWFPALALAVVALLAAAVWLVVDRVGPAARSGPALSLVVLPFKSLGNPGQDYLADIITEALTTSLARLPKSFVIAPSTAFTYKGRNVDVRQLHDELGVRYVLEGSEQSDGNRVRINAQLIDATTRAQVWGDQFDADRADLLQMQDEIVTRLSHTLQFQIADIEAARVAAVPPGDLNAEELAMRCSSGVMNAQSAPARLDQIYPLCERALQLDPRNVRALIQLAFRSLDRVNELRSADRDGDLRQAHAYIARALDVDPGNAAAHFARSQLLVAEHHFDEAIDEAQQSLALDPSFVSAYGTLAIANAYLGHPENSVEYAEKAVRLSPRDPFLFFFQADEGFPLILLGEAERAIVVLRRAVAGAPQWPIPRALLAAALAEAGREDEAREELARYVALGGPTPRTIAQFRVQLPSDNATFRAQVERITEGLRKAGMPEQ
ncbi:MAG TPA: adenylate/guanylate cyclase domain-containing protein [Stellaceae bacterium]|nr:adenylate/guanylate cyclase domain-containing protein [Stellaceae bacterium]